MTQPDLNTPNSCLTFNPLPLNDREVFRLPVLPLPPSINDAYADVPFYKGGGFKMIRTYREMMIRVGCRRVKSKTAEVYQQFVSQQLNETGITTQLREFVESHIMVYVWFYVYRAKWLTLAGLPNKNAGDADNRLKLLQDVIFKTIGIDDCCVFGNSVRKIHGEDDKVVVVISKPPDVIDEF